MGSTRAREGPLVRSDERRRSQSCPEDQVSYLVPSITKCIRRIPEFTPNLDKRATLGVAPGDSALFDGVGAPSPTLSPVIWPSREDFAIGERLNFRRLLDLMCLGLRGLHPRCDRAGRFALDMIRAERCKQHSLDFSLPCRSVTSARTLPNLDGGHGSTPGKNRLDYAGSFRRHSFLIYHKRGSVDCLRLHRQNIDFSCNCRPTWPKRSGLRLSREMIVSWVAKIGQL